MQIDRKNIKQNFKAISGQLQKAQFISFDCEFSGLVTNLQKMQGAFSDHRQFYERIKQTANNFKILQLGLTAFIFNQKTNQYESMAYNFFMLPYVNTDGFNNILVSEIESLQFLAIHGIDFNRVFKHGIIPQRLLKPFKYEGHRYNERSAAFNTNVFFDEQDQVSIDKLEKQLEMISKKQAGFTKMDFQTQVFFTHLNDKYKGAITLKKDKKTTGKFQFMVKLTSLAQQNEIVFEKQEKPANKQLKSQKQIQKKPQETIQALLQIIIKRKLPIVGHFPSLDLGLIFHTFLKPLPKSFEQFCKQLGDCFPQIYDTKVMSRRLQSHFKGIKVDLKSLYTACYNPKILEPYFNLNTQNLQKQLRGENCHQAGYDSFITGCAFIGMANFLTKNNKSEPIRFKLISDECNVTYSRDAGEIMLREPFCENSISNLKKIIILSKPKKNNQEYWKEIAQTLAKHGTLSVHEDHQQTYFVYHQENQKIQNIIDSLQKKYKLKSYDKRRICKARDLYESSQQKYLND